MAITRQFWVVAHRWAGLTIALFLTVAGFTGIFLAFMDELEGVMAPEMFHVSAPHPGAELLSPTELHARVITSHPGGIIDYMPLHFEEGHSVALGLEKLDPVTLYRTRTGNAPVGRHQSGRKEPDAIFIPAPL
jgi:uncharacterized iron-regulated membrane protein